MANESFLYTDIPASVPAVGAVEIDLTDKDFIVDVKVLGIHSASYTNKQEKRAYISRPKAKSKEKYAEMCILFYKQSK